MKIGILKEKQPENRVILMPESVTVLTDLKAEVIVEHSAGVSSFVTDEEYQSAGATIAERGEVLKQADIILHINPIPHIELEGIDSTKVLIGEMDPLMNKELVRKLQNKQITSFSLELVPRISRAQTMDILSSMDTVAGYKAVLDAAMHLPRFFPMFMSAAGTIKPAKMLVLGAGVAGLQAIAIGRKLGAVVEVFDVRSAVKDEVKSLGGKFIEVEGALEDEAAGGYAIEQTEEYRKRQSQLIHEHAIKSDVIICTAQIPGKKAPVLIKKESVEQMRPGSVIVDLAASTGGNCELSKDNQTIYHNGVAIIGKSNYPSNMQVDASSMFGRNVANLLKLLIDENGELKIDFEDEIIKGTCLTHNGEIMNEIVKSYL